jgi:hypothetical protein
VKSSSTRFNTLTFISLCRRNHTISRLQDEKVAPSYFFLPRQVNDEPELAVEKTSANGIVSLNPTKETRVGRLLQQHAGRGQPKDLGAREIYGQICRDHKGPNMIVLLDKLSLINISRSMLVAVAEPSGADRILGTS